MGGVGPRHTGQFVHFRRPPGFAGEPLTVNKMKRIVRLLRPKAIGEGLVDRIRREQHEINRESRRILDRWSNLPAAAPTYGDIGGRLAAHIVGGAFNRLSAERTVHMPKTITINIVEISNGWLVSTPGTYSESDETSLYEDRQQPVTFYPDYDCVVAAMPDIAREALKHEEDAETRRRNVYERDRARYQNETEGPIDPDAPIHQESPPMGQEPVGEQVDQTEHQQPVAEEVLSEEEAAQLKEE